MAAALLEPARAERGARFSLPVLDISHAA